MFILRVVHLGKGEDEDRASEGIKFDNRGSVL